ncbi:uncharacterized protein LOC141645807 [Silene latifolia]|uniref:uncharacterized protein LOC141645807 n=1 Tax=Silene latifolia TaxID=37657 RepID=UPI003D7703DE
MEANNVGMTIVTVEDEVNDVVIRDASVVISDDVVLGDSIVVGNDDVVLGDSIVVSNDEIDSAGSLVGDVADKWEDLYELYKKHSQAIGFNIRKSGLRRADTPGAPERERYFVCSCEGRHGNGKKAEASADINGKGKKNVKTSYDQLPREGVSVNQAV